MRYRLSVLVGLLTLVASSASAQAKPDTSKVPVPPGHWAIYCKTIGEAQCRAEAARLASEAGRQRTLDSLRTRLTAYESGGLCTAACKSAVDSLNRKIESLNRQLSTAPRQQSNTQTRPASGASSMRPSAVTRPTTTSQVAGKDQPRQIARIDTIRVPYAVPGETIFMVDTVYMNGGGSRWYTSKKLWVPAAIVASVFCPTYHKIRYDTWKYSCSENIQITRVTVRQGTGTP